jgi:hypothetical protein
LRILELTSIALILVNMDGSPQTVRAESRVQALIYGTKGLHDTGEDYYQNIETWLNNDLDTLSSNEHQLSRKVLFQLEI